MIGPGRVVGVVVLTASVLALVLAFWSGYQVRDYARCQSAVSEALIQASNARATAAEQDRLSDRHESSATAELIRAVFTVQTPGERVAAYTTYRQALDTINAAREATQADRQANPLPAPPSQTCG